MTNDTHDHEPTAAERIPMDWWNALSDRERRDLLKRAEPIVGPCSVADAWNLLVAGEIVGPPLPAGAAPIAAAETDKRRRDHQLRDFNCPCCGKFLGRSNPRLPGLTWCRDCKLEITTKHEPNPPIV